LQEAFMFPAIFFRNKQLTQLDLEFGAICVDNKKVVSPVNNHVAQDFIMLKDTPSMVVGGEKEDENSDESATKMNFKKKEKSIANS